LHLFQSAIMLPNYNHARRATLMRPN